MTEDPHVTDVPILTSSIGKELRRFAEEFRIRRMRLGATQRDVGAALATDSDPEGPWSDLEKHGLTQKVDGVE